MDWHWKTIIEPFKIKSIEPLGFATHKERKKHLEEAGYNLFKIPADKVLIDLLTDSGTAAMSAEQWGALMRGDESYAGARSFYTFESVIKNITGYSEVIPVHQGRAAERILFSFLCKKGDIVPANSHFDTTRANIEVTGAEARDLPVADAWKFHEPIAFKGNMDVAALEKLLHKEKEKIPLVILTITNNSLGGQPVSMENIKAVSQLCKQYSVPLFFDAARFAENAYFIKLGEKEYTSKMPFDIAREMFSCADGCLMSAKKDALVNIGGFLAMNNTTWAKKAREIEIIGEGFPTYGGLAGRDLEAIAQGLKEVLDEEYLKYRIQSVSYLGYGIKKCGVPIVEPPGGHAVYVDAKAFLSHIPPEGFPAQALACALYLEAGIRTTEVGSLMFGKRDPKSGNFTPAKMELLRLAVPRRVYTQSHIDFVIEVFEHIAKSKNSIRGLKIIEAPPVLSHFMAKLAPV
ncbi:MAG: tryptophanase [Candidatus Melainabacteria bacterium]|nr:tryptophanase [Candidatus Melainabacteria bacterium]MBI3309396.1 tryptophanase [Candidatus Melainabacteria bacterium]